MNAGLIGSNLLVYSAQIALVAIGAAAILWLIRLRAPAARLLYWQSVIAGCLLLPVLRPWKALAVNGAITFTTSAVSAAAPKNAPTWSLPSFATLVLGAIGTGVAIRLALLFIGLWRLRRYRMESGPFAAGAPWTAHAELRISNEVTSPVTFGYRNPVVLLPANFGELAPGIQDAVLCHEVAHVWRSDWAWTVAEEVLRAAFWFHPALWWMLGEAQLAREQAVDQMVIEMTGAREGYVDALLAIAGAAVKLDVAPAPLFLKRRHLKQRVVSILKEARMSRTRLVSAFAAGVAMLAGVCWIVTGALPLTAAPQMVNDAPGVSVQAGSAGLMHRAPVTYPEGAIAKGVQGTVVVEARLGADGSVVDASVASGPDELRKAALESVLNWHFERAAAGTTQQVTIDFTLPATAAGAEARPAGAARTMAILSPVPPQESSVIQAVEISGLSDTAKSQLLAQMPVHEGDTMTMADAGKIVSAAQAFDSHLMVQFNTAPGGITIRVRPQMAPMVAANVMAANGMMTLAIPAADARNVSLSASPTAIRVGAQVQQANLISQVTPVYPPLAKQARVQGTVQLEATIGADGHVENLRAISGPPLLVSAAVDAAKNWVYKPTLLNGNPIRVITLIDINFTLAQ